MPLYDYKCTECEHEEELIVSFKDLNENQYCDVCKKETLERKISAPGGFSFKGIKGSDTMK